MVRELVGHGLGAVMHEAPEMPNYGRRGRGKQFKEGLVVAIEPAINLFQTHQAAKGRWTILTADGKAGAAEHNVAIVNGQPGCSPPSITSMTPWGFKVMKKPLRKNTSQ